MPEFYIDANSFAAPFFSDPSHAYVEAPSAGAALEKFAADYRHPCGLYAAAAYASADARNKGADPLARWLSNQARALEGITGTVTQKSVGVFEINGEHKIISDPKAGGVVA